MARATIRPVDSEGPAVGPAEPYWAFYERVAAAQLRSWLPDQPSRVLDLSGIRPSAAQVALDAGHRVLRVIPAATDGMMSVAFGRPWQDRVVPVVGEAGDLSWMAADTVDVVLAEQRAMSYQLATELTVEQVARVLRPGGRLLLCVDSLVLGLARLAEQGRWAELADAPAADVLLVPAEDGTITRCFGPDQLREVITDAGLELEWIRPRTVLSRATVDRAAARSDGWLAELVSTELRLAAEREGESVGIHLLASARKPA